MRSCAIMVLGGSLLCAAAPGPRWIALGADASGRYAYDAASVTRTGDRVRAEVRVVSTGTTDRPKRMEAQLEVDCRERTSAVLAVRQLDDGGAVIRSWTIPPTRIVREPLVAGADHAMLYARLCPHGRPLPRPPEPPVGVGRD